MPNPIEIIFKKISTIILLNTAIEMNKVDNTLQING
jgi:hypothetical protein